MNRWNTLKVIGTTKQMETSNLKVKNPIHDSTRVDEVGNQPPSTLTGEGSTTIPTGSTLKRVEVQDPSNEGEDIVCSSEKSEVASEEAAKV